MGLGDQNKVMLRKTEHHFILVAVLYGVKSLSEKRSMNSPKIETMLLTGASVYNYGT
jgi:hypothetical protein